MNISECGSIKKGLPVYAHSLDNIRDWITAILKISELGKSAITSHKEQILTWDQIAKEVASIYEQIALR